MAKVGYIGDSSVKYNYGGTNISNGVVGNGQNLTQQGYPSSIGTSTSTSTSNGTRSTSGSSTSGSSGGKSSGGSSGTSTAGGTSTADAYNSLLAAYRGNDYSGYLGQMQAAAQGAYDRGMAALDDAYNSQISNLQSNLQSTQGMLSNQYNRSRGNIVDDAADALKQAYINRMKSERNIGQQMAALGLNGGATESTLAGMINNYGNARNNIETTENDNLSDLEGNYSDNLAQALQAYNSAVAAADAQRAQQQMALENALANNQIAAISDYQSLMQRDNQNYLDLLQTAIANGASFTYNPATANNAVNAVAVNQATMPTTANNLNAAQNLTATTALPGVTTPGITVVNPTTQGNELADILAQLY